MTNTHLVLGGARSGKSTFAEQKALDLNRTEGKLVYIATATAGDQEMSERIQQHQARRGKEWHLIEEPIVLSKQISCANNEDTILIDCLTLWLSNCLHKNCWAEQREAFLQALITTQANVVMVSNEVGSGIVPMGQMSRQFIDQSGWLHQALSASCSTVTLIIAGLPIHLKTQTT